MEVEIQTSIIQEQDSKKEDQSLDQMKQDTDMSVSSEAETTASIETNEMVQAVVFDVEGSRKLEQMFAKIPNQMAFKIGDVADIAEVKPYVLRYWEQEFDILKPKKAVNNQRIYSRRDVENVLMIKKFLHVDKFSIPGAIRAIKLARKRHAQGVDAMPKGPSEKDLKALDVRMEMLLSKIRSSKGKLIHKFFQLGL